uniref:ribonuclease H n=1 Tax=Salvator merianae TaxID=96440 RepID=A0A8D0BUQ0_SALMN
EQDGGKGVDTLRLLDTRAQLSVINSKIAPSLPDAVSIIGATGRVSLRPKLAQRELLIGGKMVMHFFVYVPECPVPLIGRDLLHKLQASIAYKPDGNTDVTFGTQPVRIGLAFPAREEWWLYQTYPLCTDEERKLRLRDSFGTPLVWAEDNPPGLARRAPPQVVQLKPSARVVNIKQYPIPMDARQSIQKHLTRLLEAGILVEVSSAWNTPLLPVKKPGTEDYRPVQDLWGVKDQVETIQPTVANPYVLLSLIPGAAAYFSVLDLKDAFFCVPLAKVSQPYFAFTWEEPQTGAKIHYTWCRLPQGFKNSPTMFGNQLRKDLREFQVQEGQVLQYVDDLLVPAETAEDCYMKTKRLLQHLEELGYRMSYKKAQLCQQEVMYLGFQIRQGDSARSANGYAAVCGGENPYCVVDPCSWFPGGR